MPKSDPAATPPFTPKFPPPANPPPPPPPRLMYVGRSFRATPRQLGFITLACALVQARCACHARCCHWPVCWHLNFVNCCLRVAGRLCWACLNLHPGTPAQAVCAPIGGLMGHYLNRQAHAAVAQGHPCMLRRKLRC